MTAPQSDAGTSTGIAMTMAEVFEKYHYPGRTKFTQILRRLGNRETTKEIDAFIKEQPINQIFNEAHRFPGHIISFSYLDRIQMDIIDVSKFAMKNKGIHFILLIIDIFTRTVWAYPMKAKDIPCVMKALENFLSENAPNIIISDNESAFMSKEVQGLLKKHHILHMTCEVGDHKVLGIVDRFCRTIKVNLHKYMTHEDTTKYIDHFSDLIDSYNDSPHRGLYDLSPNEAMEAQHEVEIFDLNLQKGKHNGKNMATLLPGDTVRIRNRKKQFERAYEAKYADIQRIVSADKHRATLEDGSTVNLRRVKKVVHTRDDPTHDALAEELHESKVKKALAREHLDIESKEYAIPNTRVLRSSRY